LENFGPMLENATVIGMPSVSDTFIRKVELKEKDNPLRNLEHVAMGYLHVRQIFTAVHACGHKDVECQKEVFAASPAESDVGFLRWEKNVAVFDSAVEIYREGRFINFTNSLR